MRISRWRLPDQKQDAVLLLACVLVALSTWGADQPPIVPDDRLTPGAILTLDTAKVCRPGYSDTVRKTTEAMKAKVYQMYGLHNAPGPDYAVDHRIPLALGGADVLRNLWPESYQTEPWNAHVKDRLERYVHTRVCVMHTMTLLEGQRLFQGDWTQAYREYLGRP